MQIMIRIMIMIIIHKYTQTADRGCKTSMYAFKTNVCKHICKYIYICGESE